MVPLLKKLEEVKEDSHVAGGHALMRVYKDCPRQGTHMDYFTVEPHSKVRGETLPYSVVVALESNSFLYVEGAKVSLPARHAVVFRG